MIKEQEIKKNVVVNKGTNKCITAMVCGIVGLVLSFCSLLSIFGFILGIIAIVFAVVGKKQMPNHKDGKATTGLICGIIAIPLSLICFCCTACIYYSTFEILNSSGIDEEEIKNEIEHFYEDVENDIMNDNEVDTENFNF